MNNKVKGDLGEEFVNKLAFQTYLKYWCYPNPLDFHGDKKEICDLLISFRNILIIISVKNHNYNGDYEKYKRKVIDKSSNQLNGAYRKLFASNREIWIKHPDREPELFDPKNYKFVYRLTINVGEQFEYYELCDKFENKGIINIFNKDTFEAIIKELDTIKDLVDYLFARESLLLSGKKITFNCDEKDLLAEFLINARKFPFDCNSIDSEEIILNLEGAWKNYIKHKSVKLKKEANKSSYFIDNLVKTDILKLPDGEILAKELMNLGRTERRLVANALISLVVKCEKQNDIFARRYFVHNGIGHLLIYYPPNQKEKDVDFIIQRAMEIYSYKTNFTEREIITIAATNKLKQYKFGMLKIESPFSNDEKKYLDQLIESFGWFKDMKAFHFIENEYPSDNDD